MKQSVFIFCPFLICFILMVTSSQCLEYPYPDISYYMECGVTLAPEALDTNRVTPMNQSVLLPFYPSLDSSEWSSLNPSFIAISVFSVVVVEQNPFRVWSQGAGVMMGANISDLTSTSYPLTDITTFFGSLSIIQLTTSDFVNLAILSDGNLYSWGTNLRPTTYATWAPVLGQPNMNNLSIIPQMLDMSNIYNSTKGTNVNNNKIDSIACCTYACIAASSISGNIYFWGSNVISTPDDINFTLIPTLWIESVTKPIATYGNANFFLIQYNDQSIACFGSNWQGSCTFYNISTFYSSPVILEGILPYSKISVGLSNNILLLNNGSLFAWGYSPNYEIGNCSSTSSICDKHVIQWGIPTFDSIVWIDVMAAPNMTYALSSDFQVYFWGATRGVAPIYPLPTLVAVPSKPGFKVQTLSNVWSQSYCFMITSSFGDVNPSCSGSPPDPSFVCQGGTWTYYTSATLNSSISIVGGAASSPVIIHGNLTLTSDTTLTFSSTSPIASSGGTPLLQVEGCLDISGYGPDTIILELTLSDLSSLSTSSSNPTSIHLISQNTNSNCSLDLTSLNANLKYPQTCKKIKFQTDRNASANDLVVLVSVSNIDCNLWWIITASVLGGVLLLVLVIILLVSFNERIKGAIRPFWIRSQVNKS